MLKHHEADEASGLKAYIKQMKGYLTVWTSELSPLSQAAHLMAAQSHLSKAADWREATMEEVQSSINSLCCLENWQFGTYGFLPLISGAAWMWSEESPQMRLALCFGAFKRALAERQHRKQTLREELQLLAGESLTLRHGS